MFFSPISFFNWFRISCSSKVEISKRYSLADMPTEIITLIFKKMVLSEDCSCRDVVSFRLACKSFNLISEKNDLLKREVIKIIFPLTEDKWVKGVHVLLWNDILDARNGVSLIYSRMAKRDTDLFLKIYGTPKDEHERVKKHLQKASQYDLDRVGECILY